MNYHNITTDDMLNGAGLRTVLWVSGCSHHCKNCHNPETWDCKSGITFNSEAMLELTQKLNKPYIKGLTISGGDGLHPNNLQATTDIVKWIYSNYPNKDIWVYTGYSWEDIKDLAIMQYVDVIVDGRYVDELSDINYHWAGSTNQRIIDVKQSLEKETIILYQ